MKTTIDVPPKEWLIFSKNVLEKRGNHKLNEAVVSLIIRVNKGEIEI